MRHWHLPFFKALASSGSSSSSSSSGSSSGIIIQSSINTTPRALMGGGVTYNPTFINSDYRAYYSSSIVNYQNTSILNGTLPLQNWNNINNYGLNISPYVFNFMIPTVLTKYRLWNGFMANVYREFGQGYQYSDIGNQTPQGWTIQGSNDDLTWTTIDTRTSQARLPYATSVDPSVSSYSEFTIASPAAYKSYRMNITSPGRVSYNCGKSGCSYDTQIGEIQLWGYESPATSCALHGYNTNLPFVKYLNSSGAVSDSVFVNAFRQSTSRGNLSNTWTWSNPDRVNDMSKRVGTIMDTGYMGVDYPITITSYKMWTSGINSWKWYGANTFGSWTLFDTRSSVSSGSNVTFSISSPTSYKYYKIELTGSSSQFCYKDGCNYTGRVNDIQINGYLT